MKMLTRIIIGFTSLLSVSHCWVAPPEELSGKITTWLENYKVPAAAVAFIDEGKLEWTNVYGDRILGTGADAGTIFNVASLTKPAFGMMVLQLVENGELELDTSLSTFWIDPDVAEDKYHENLTARIALSHQTGFPNWRRNGKLSFDFEPGSKHGYSGEGFEYLRRAVERKTGKSMNELMEQHVIKNAGMKDTFWGWDERLFERFAVNHDHVGKPIKSNSLKSRKPNAAANMFTTIDDYGKFSEWVLAGADLTDSMFEEMQKKQSLHPNPIDPFGLSWKLTQVGDETVIWHDGREFGLFTQVVLWPMSRQGIVVFTNGDHGELVTRRIVAEATDRGKDFLREKSLDSWKYLSSLTEDELVGVMNRVVKTPAFVEMLLMAIESSLPVTSSVSEAERIEARQLFGQLVSVMISRGLEPNASAAIRQFMDAANDSQKQGQRFNDDQFRSLTATIRSAANPTEIDLKEDELKAFEGKYRIREGKWTGLTFVVQVENESLAVRFSDGDSEPAIPISKSMLSVPSGHMHLEFNNGNTDTVTVFAVNNQTLIAHLVHPEEK